jgi:hypothetical protein
MGKNMFKVFKLFFPDGGYGFAWVLFNPDENDIVMYKTRCYKVNGTTCFIPYEAIPGEVLNDGARYFKPDSHFSTDMHEKLAKKRPHDYAIMNFIWKTMKSPIIEYVGEIPENDLKIK